MRGGYTLNQDNRITMTTATFDNRDAQVKKGTIVNLKAATLADTGYAFGIALSAATTGNEVTIGVFRMPVSIYVESGS
jgi:hypothetical protein